MDLSLPLGIGEADSARSSPAPEIPSSPFLGTVPWWNCPQTDALSPQEQKALELRALAPQDCSSKVKSPKLTSGSRRPAQWFRGLPGPYGTLRSRGRSALGVPAQPKPSAPTEAPFLPSSVAATHAAPPNLRRLSQAFAAGTRREHWPGGGRAQGSPAPGRASPRPVPPTQSQLGRRGGGVGSCPALGRPQLRLSEHQLPRATASCLGRPKD